MGVSFAHYGEKRTVDATEDELKIFDVICDMFPDEKIVMVRKSPNYVTAICHGMDIARFKSTKKAKWIKLPYVLEDKVKLTDPGDVRQLRSDLEQAIDIAKK